VPRFVVTGLDARLALELPWRGAGLARVLDEGHARLVETSVRLLSVLGWEVITEYTFNHYGERGSVDIVAWHPLARILLVVEVKTQLADLQDTLARLHAKVRVVPPLLARERGWKPVAVARLLVIADRTAQRDIVARHRAIFDGAFPLRGRAVRRWLAEPIGAMSGVVFFRDSRAENTARRLGGDGRVEATGRGRGRA